MAQTSLIVLQEETSPFGRDRQRDWKSGDDITLMIRKLQSGKFRLYSRKKTSRTGTRRNLGTFSTRTAAEKHERAVQFFKRKH